MKGIIRISLLVVLLISGVTGPVLGQKDTAEWHWYQLSEKAKAALARGDYRQGSFYAKGAYDYALEHFREKNPFILYTSFNNLARLHAAQGRWGEAEKLYRKALEFGEKAFGRKHEFTLVSINGLAVVCKSTWQYREAEKLLDEALQMRKEIFGLEHEHTLNSMNNLGNLYRKLGRYEEAGQFFNKVLKLRKKIMGPNHPATLVSMNNLSLLYYEQGRYPEAESLFEETLQLREATLGKAHPDTITSMSNLAGLYEAQGRYDEAESLYNKAALLSSAVIGLRHPDTLDRINMLAALYQHQGLYDEAELLLKKVLEYKEDVLESEHPATLGSISRLASLYHEQGRYSESESLYNKVIRIRKEVQRYGHPDTIATIHGLASLYKSQGRYGEAESLYKDADREIRKIKGNKHPDYLALSLNLAILYEAQGRHSEAAGLCKETVQTMKEVLGDQHPNTLKATNSLGTFYCHIGLYDEAEKIFRENLRHKKKALGRNHPSILRTLNNLSFTKVLQGRYSEAEQLYNDLIQSRKEVLGSQHPDTVRSVNSLASLYYVQGRYSEAEPLYKQSLQFSEKMLGKEHPDTLSMQIKYIYLLVSTNRFALALHLLKDQESHLLSRSFQELYTSSSEKVRRLYLQSISEFQNIALSLASQQPEKEYQQFAAEVMLRWKQVYADESRVQHQLLTFNNDEESKKINKKISASQKKLSQALRQQEEKLDISELIEKANQDETALLALARHLRTDLEVTNLTLDDVLSALPQDSGLIEYWLFQPVDFKTGKLGEYHVAALLLLADPKAEQSFLVHDVGSLEELTQQFAWGSGALYTWLLDFFDKQIKKLDQLYIAPDDVLSLLSFASLRLPDGRFLAERQQINRLQTGRDLLEDKENVPSGKGMVAVGGVNYGPQPKTAEQIDLDQIATRFKGATRQLENGFAYLSESRREAQNIFDKYKSTPKGTRFIGDDASEYNLKHLKQPPRILHLSTHGFYLTDDKNELADEAPLLLSGLALAGANNGLQGKLDEHGDDGLLYSLEVLGLNLQGTELVSLSACDTGKGVVDYSEGVYGLVRAFRTAGAKNVLMTLTPVEDKASKDFMEKFYDHCLAENLSPSRALHKTRLDFIRNGRPVKDWSPYVMVGR